MRVFIIVCLAASAFAAPQGYNYQQQQQQQQQQQLSNFGSIGRIQTQTIAQQGQNFLQEALHNPKLMQTLLNEPSGTYSIAPQGLYQPPQQQQGYQQSGNYAYNQPQQQQYQPGPIVTKDIFVHVAPQEQEERYRPAPLPQGPPRKHYRIVFIKAPAPTISPAALRVNQAQTEEKTIIYVLTKKPDPLDLETAIQDVAPKQPTKPEVYFIKYKTQEEAQHAQRAIQAQYDQLGGTTQVSDEGVAPVTSVIGAFDQHQQQHQHQQVQQIAGGTAPSSIGGTGIGTTGSGGGGGSVSVTSGVESSGSGTSKYLPPIVRI